MRVQLAIALTFCLGACVDVPELDDRLQPQLRDRVFPELVPLETTLGPPVDPEDEAAQLQEDLAARSEALQARTEALRQAEVIDEKSRERLQP